MFIGTLILFQAALISYKAFSGISAKKPHITPAFMAFWTGILGFILVGIVAIMTGGFIPSKITVLTGITGGLCFAIAGVLSIHIMATGPFIWSVLMMNLSSFLPVLFALTILGETISIMQIVGVFLILSILLIMSIGLKSDDRPFTPRWMALAVINMLINGGILCSQKAQSTFMNGEQPMEMLAVMFLSASVFAGIYSVIVLKGKEKPDFRVFIPPAIGLIISLGAGNLISMILMGYITAAVQFPIVVGGGIVMSAILSIVYYKERLNWRIFASAALLISGVIFLGI